MLALLPGVAMFVTIVLLTHHARALLVGAAAGEPVEVGPGAAILLIGGFLSACASVVVLQAARTVDRVAGPERRLVLALQRVRSGDLAFRVDLRRGDLLAGLAGECNALIEWLNVNPPVGVHTGTDIVEVSVPESDEGGS